jgi:imidazole glycerol-phosphate synthase subunit HisH
MATVALIDYGAGNIRSLSNALSYVGADVRLVRAREDLEGASHVVLPGVGAFGYCAERLRESGLIPALEEWALNRSLPILGICVGMQLLAEWSEERGNHPGLNWIGGRVTRLQTNESALRIPHVGWNDVTFNKDFGEFSKGQQADFYFDHSYAYFDPREGEVLAECTHGETFCAAIHWNNMIGVQFHPEKSQTPGLRFLRGFLAMSGQ